MNDTTKVDYRNLESYIINKKKKTENHDQLSQAIFFYTIAVVIFDVKTVLLHNNST